MLVPCPKNIIGSYSDKLRSLGLLLGGYVPAPVDRFLREEGLRLEHPFARKCGEATLSNSTVSNAGSSMTR